MGVALFARAVERPLVHTGRIGALVQPTTGRLELHTIDINTSVVACVDVVRVSAWSSDRSLVGRLSLCHACKRYHEQSYRNQQDSAPHKHHPFL